MGALLSGISRLERLIGQVKTNLQTKQGASDNNPGLISADRPSSDPHKFTHVFQGFVSRVTPLTDRCEREIESTHELSRPNHHRLTDVIEHAANLPPIHAWIMNCVHRTQGIKDALDHPSRHIQPNPIQGYE